MKTKTPLLHLLVVPLITLLACNGLTLVLLDSLSWYRQDFIKYLALAVMTLYQLYLMAFHSPQRKSGWSILISSMLAFFWIHTPVPFVIWGVGAIALFSFTRIFLLKRDAMLLWQDLAYAFAGSGLGIFFAPLSLFLAVMIFVTTQVLCEMRVPIGERSLVRDCFQESLKTVLRVINKYQ